MLSSQALLSKIHDYCPFIPPNPLLNQQTMVYYFTSNVVDPPATIYVGKDKFESPLFPLPPTVSLTRQ